MPATFDTLPYELKYKRDDGVMELVREYKELEEMASVSDALYNEQYEKAEHLNKEIISLKSDINGMSHNMDAVVDVLNDSLDGTKTDLKAAIENAMDLLKRLTQDMDDLS